MIRHSSSHLKMLSRVAFISLRAILATGALILSATTAHADRYFSLCIRDSAGNSQAILTDPLTDALESTALFLSFFTGRPFRLAPVQTDSADYADILMTLVGELAVDSGCAGLPRVSLFPRELQATLGGPGHFVDSLRPTTLSRRRLAYDLIDPLVRFADTRPVNKKSQSRAKRRVPLSLFVDSSYIRHAPAGWDARLKRLLDVINKQLTRQLDVSLELKSLSIVSFAADTDPTVNASYDALARQFPHSGDTLALLIRGDTSRTQSATSHSVHLGMSEHGSRRLVVYTPRFDERADTLAWYFETAVTIMHELGHAWGAVHVYDPRSVMNHSLSPYGSLHFDRVNESIVRAFLDGSPRVNRSLDLRLVDSLLIATEYASLDLPELFARVVPAGMTADALERELAVSGLSGQFQSALRIYNALLDQNEENSIDAFGSLSNLLDELPQVYASLFLFATIKRPDDLGATYWLTRAVEANYDLASEYIVAQCDLLRQTAIPPVDNE